MSTTTTRRKLDLKPAERERDIVRGLLGGGNALNAIRRDARRHLGIEL